MTIQAQFNKIKWEISDNKIMTINSLSYSFGVKTESKKGAGGNDKIVVKGYKKDSLSVSYTVDRMCGVNPEQEHAKACDIIGVKDTFILGGKRFGPLKTMLMKVKPSNAVFAPDGLIISMDITLTFGEPEEEKEKKTAKKKKASKSKLSIAVNAKDVEKKKNAKGIKS